MPGGAPGTDLVELIRNVPLHLAPVWKQFWKKMLFFLAVFLGRFSDDVFIDFWWFSDYFEEVFGQLFLFVLENVK